MPQGLYIDARQLKKGAAAFDKLVKQMPDLISDVLNASALEIEAKAKRRVPKDRGASGLAGSISADTTTSKLQKRITANAPYAAYVEFGTGKYASQAVSGLPASYQAFAAQFRSNSGRRSIKGLLFMLMDWFERKGIKDKQQRYFIAKSIFINGTHPHPFLINSLIEQEKTIRRDMVTLLNQLQIK